jgi:predicted kinase
MPVLYIPVGIPGCGKSALRSAFPHALAVSSDDIRAEPAFGGNVYDQSKNDLVFSEFHARIDLGLRARSSVYADATSLNTAARARLREVAARVNADSQHMRIDNMVTTHVLLFRNLSQAIKRNAERERVVPADAMLRMIEKYEQTISAFEHHEAAMYDHVTEISKVS